MVGRCDIDHQGQDASVGEEHDLGLVLPTHSPLSSGREGSISIAFTPVDLAVRIELAEKSLSSLIQGSIAGPLNKALPGSGIRRKARRQGISAGAAAADP